MRNRIFKKFIVALEESRRLSSRSREKFSIVQKLTTLKEFRSKPVAG